MSKLRVERPSWEKGDDFISLQPMNMVEHQCYHCGMHNRIPVTYVDNGEAQMWREQYEHICASLNAMSAEIDEWFDVNPWREQAKVLRKRMDELLQRVRRDGGNV